MHGLTDSGQALIQGREDGAAGNINVNPYDRRIEKKLWEQYERGYTAGRSRWVGKRAIEELRRPQ